MHIVLVGPGALGCLFTSTLIKGNSGNINTISLLDHNSNRAEQITAKGLLYQKGSDAINFAVNAFSNPAEIGKVDAIFLCVKSYDVEKTLKFCSPLLQENTLLNYMQNGMSHLAQNLNFSRVIQSFCTTTVRATCLSHGHVRHAGVGATFFGFLQPQLEVHNTLLLMIIELLKAGGMNVSYSKNIYRRLWAKLFINVGINALTVIHDCKNGDLLNIPKAQETMAQAIAEAQQVAKVAGVEISKPHEKTIEVCRATAENISSMLQDIRHKKKTEIDAINGAIVKMAAMHNIATPVNSLLFKLVKEIEQ